MIARAPSRDLSSLRDLLALVQCGLAVAAVALGGGASTWATVLLVVFVAVAFVRPLPDETGLLAQRTWTGLVVVGLAASFFRAFYWSQILDAGVDFLFLLVAQRFFQRQKTRQHLQLLLLGSVLMTIAAVINAELSFPILLTLWVPVAALALLVNTLMGEGERLGKRVVHDLGRHGLMAVRRLLPSIGLVAGVVGLSGLVVFLAFPRFGVGVFLRGSFAERSVTGFSEEVTLGGFGRIKNDARVVMHIDMLEGFDERPERLRWYLRGSAFDTYESGRWLHGKDAEHHGFTRYGFARFFVGVVEPKAGVVHVVPRPGFERSTEMVHARVTLDDIGTELIFAASEPLGARLVPRGPIERQNALAAASMDRQLRVLSKQPGPIRYEFYSRVTMPTTAELAAVGNPEVPHDLAAYVLPSQGLSDEVSNLARDLTKDATTRYEKVDAVMEYLLSLEYTLDQTVSARVLNGADPIEGFLFDTRRGHCEYFATAMAVLLREVGVPTRNVNGYYGAEWNDVGGFYAVRQASAHSWVEVHFGELGWVTFDPTPPSGREAGDDAALLPAISERIDALRNAYLTWVIDYNIGRQLELLENIGVTAEPDLGTVDIDWRRVAIGVGLPFAVALVGFALSRLGRRNLEPEEIRICRAVLARLRARGRTRRPDESMSRFAERLARESTPEAAPFGEFARAYDQLRFGASAPHREDLARLRSLADHVR